MAPKASGRRYESVLRRFGRMRVGVVGDFLADHYIFGAPSRLSREAPVIVLRWESEHTGPGGAANSAANLLALGAQVSLVGALGDDEPGRALRARFREAGADDTGLRLLRGHRTITKTRVLAGDLHRSKQQVIRVDREPDGAPPPSVERHVLASVRRLAGEVDAWLVSDYGYGTVTPKVYAALRDGPGGADRVVVVDSRRRLTEFQGATALTPNEEEAASATGRAAGTRQQAAAAGRDLIERTGARHVLLTRGNQGLALVSGDRPPHFVAVSSVEDAEEITDNNGAGDTVAATFTLALAAGAEPTAAAALANHAGGLVVMKPGAATINRSELRARCAAAEKRR